MEAIKTGISGFDAVTGGVPKGHTLLLAGPTGSYTELFGLEFLYRGAIQKENVVYISFEKKEEDLVEMTSVFDWNLSNVIDGKNFIVMSSELFNYSKFISSLEDTIFSYKATRLVLDSISFLGGFFDTPFKFRTSLGELRTMLNRHDCTSMLVSESRGNELSPYGVEEFIADGIIQLHNIKKGNNVTHALSVPEMSGMEISPRLYPLELTKKGMKVREIPLVL
ncbi:RAD55 family ATPase [archaeon]